MTELFQSRVERRIADTKEACADIAKHVAKNAADGDMRSLSTNTLQLMERHGELSIWVMVGQHIDYANSQNEEFNAADIRKDATKILLRGADDSWSGRTNDNQRSIFDGQRRAIDLLLSNLDAL